MIGLVAFGWDVHASSIASARANTGAMHVQASANCKHAKAFSHYTQLMAGIEPAPAAHAAVHHYTTPILSQYNAVLQSMLQPMQVQCNLSSMIYSHVTSLQVQHDTLKTSLMPTRLARYPAHWPG